MAYRTRIVRIGNSQGIRIPKALLEESDLAEEVELEVVPGAITIRSTDNPRAGWEETFAENACEDELLIPDDLPNAFDDEEWRWE